MTMDSKGKNLENKKTRNFITRRLEIYKETRNSTILQMWPLATHKVVASTVATGL